jgi:spore germination cell wall hydrolase CwlJ-like protein
MKISLKPKSSVFINVPAKILKVVGLSLVLWAVAHVCFQKLNYLKQNRIGLGANYVTAAEKTKQLECLTKNIYWEAASEPFEGKVGVAQVTMNRVASGKFASSVCGVVHQKNIVYEKVICQFSWYCESVSKVRPIHRELWKESEEVAKKVLLENFRLPSLKNALYYHADYVSPGWKLPRIEKIGRHIFYGDKNAI